jgi:hypothetical protein
VSETLLRDAENDERLEILEEPQPIRFEGGEIIPRHA